MALFMGKGAGSMGGFQRAPLELHIAGSCWREEIGMFLPKVNESWTDRMIEYSISNACRCLSD